MDSEDSSDEQRSDADQKRSPTEIVSSFLLHAPPGEFVEVLDAVKGIVKDESVIEAQRAKVFPKYTKMQLTPVKLDDTNHALVLSNFNSLGENRFFDPRTKQSFSYDHLTGSISDLAPWQPEQEAESWRSALEEQWIEYSREHYHEGAGSVFSTFKDEIVTLNACLEGHQFQPKKYWNGRWRSIWSIAFKPAKDEQVDLNGSIRLRVHYYEDGNVQLVSSRNCEQKITINKPEQVAKDIMEAVKKFENDYQRAISENYQTMSDTTFKALRRPLPVIRSKIEWHKLKSYKIGSELKQQ